LKTYVFSSEETSEITKTALENSGFEILDIFNPGNISEDSYKTVLNKKPDFCFFVDFCEDIPKDIINTAANGSWGIHLSLLPAYQGKLPVEWAIKNGERKIGVTLYKVLSELHNGEIVDQEDCPILKTDDSKTLFDKLLTLTGVLLDTHLPKIKSGDIKTNQMDLSGASRYDDLTDADLIIDWSQSALDIYNKVRSFARLKKGAKTSFMGKDMTVWKLVQDETSPAVMHSAEIEEEDQKLYVGTKFGTVVLEKIEWKGRIMEKAQIAEELGPHWRETFKMK
jgi:methionyl-tRNA formyltransferase